jgi:N-methylhydantoinase A
MAEMVRLATLRRGLDPRDFALVAFGGAGPLHACEIAREVGIPKVLIPIYPGLFSAIGTLMGERRHDLVQTHVRRIADAQLDVLSAAFSTLGDRAADLIAAEHTGGHVEWSTDRSIDLRFEGQLFELSVPLESGAALSPEALESRFRQRHTEVYGYDLPQHAVEIVNLRLVVRAPVWGGAQLAQRAHRTPGTLGRRRVWGADGESFEVPVVQRHSLQHGQTLQGPAIIEDFGATVRILDRQLVRVLKSGVLEIEVDHVG